MKRPTVLQAMYPRSLVPKPDLAAALDRHGANSESLLAILRDLDASRRGIDTATTTEVAQVLSLPRARVEGVARFYSMLERNRDPQREVRACGGIVCRLHGAEACRSALADRAEAKYTDVTVKRSSCLGLCDRAPAAYVDGRQLGPLTPERVANEQLGSDSPPVRVVGEDRFLLRDPGRIDPRSIADAIANGAWNGLERALRGRPEEIVDEVDRSGLSGRGGAGFPTGRKWRLVDTSKLRPLVVCNADESEPLMFKDRFLLESDPHLVLEGIAIAARAVGAAEAVVYIRGEYEPQAVVLEHAIAEARSRGFLGDRILGSDFGLEIRVHRGAGAYICGEESALIASLEGRRGEPTLRPPYPVERGFEGRPTLVNNVETLAAVAGILRHGVEEFQRHGTSARPGTRLYTLLGHVAKPGLVETTQDVTLREMIDRWGAGLQSGSTFGFALTGGAAGTFAVAGDLDQPFDAPSAEGGPVSGSGGILVCDDTVNPIEVLSELLRFFEEESCGKCTPCRVGTSVARTTVDELLNGEGGRDHLDRLHRLAAVLRSSSLCGLGTGASLPLRSALAKFPEHFEALVQ